MSIIAQGTYHRAPEGLAENLLVRFAPSQQAYEGWLADHQGGNYPRPREEYLAFLATRPIRVAKGFERFKTFNPVFKKIAAKAEYQGPIVYGRHRSLPNWGAADNGALLLRYMNAFARKIQLCWFNREEQPMACPCPESP